MNFGATRKNIYYTFKSSRKPCLQSFLGFLCGPSIWVASIWVKSFLISLDPRWVNWGFAKAVRFSRSKDRSKKQTSCGQKKSPTSRVDADLKKQGQYLGHAIFFGGLLCESSFPRDFSEFPPKNADGGVLNSGNDLSSATRETHLRCHPEMFPWQPSRSRMANVFRNVAGWDEKFFVITHMGVS